jgi:PAS domain S-box-containing protein
MTNRAAEPQDEVLSSAIIENLRSSAAWLAVVVLLNGIVVLAGWITGAGLLKSVLPGLVQMKANTALGFICCGFALWLVVRRPERRILIRALIGVAILLGSLTLIEYLSGRNLGIDQLLFTESAGAVGTLSPGRMAPTSALCFVLIGLALLLIDRSVAASELLAGIAGFIAVQTFLGYIFGLQFELGFERYTQMALHTAAAFAALAFGVLFARPDRGLMTVVSAPGGAGRTARNLLPAMIILPLVLAVVISAGDRVGFYEESFAWAAFVDVNMVVCAVLVWWNAHSVMMFDRKRRQLIDTVPAVIWERRYTERGELVRSYVSPYIRPFLGYTEQEWLSTDDFWRTAVDEKDRDAVDARLRDVVTSSTSMLCRLTSKDGKRLWAELSTTGFGGIDGGRSGTRTVIVDATDSINARIRREIDDKIFTEFSTLNSEMAMMQRTLVQQQAELRSMNEEKNHFIGMAAHDLRNPLAGIRLFSDVLLRQGSAVLNEKQLRMVEQIKSISQKMTAIVNDFLDVSKIESGELSLTLQEVNLNGLVADVVELQQQDAARKEIRLEFTPVEQITAKVDSGKIEQVVTNLITNAVKFSPPGSTVTIGLARRDGIAEVFVADEGPGIAADEIARLFRPFQRGSAVVTGQEQSVGLGLAICKKIVEGHGGRIRVESEIGKGATFYVELPVEASRLSATSTDAAASAAVPSAPISRQSSG